MRDAVQKMDTNRRHFKLPMFLCLLVAACAAAQHHTAIQLTPQVSLASVRNGQGEWGLTIRGAGLASAEAPKPIEITLSSARGHPLAGSYQSTRLIDRGFSATGTLQAEGATILVEDRWTGGNGVLHLSRRLSVTGLVKSTNTGFFSGIVFRHLQPATRDLFDVFVPGMIYGSTAHLTASAIGGSDTYGPYGDGVVRIREDRMPAPLYAVRFADGSAFAVLDPHPIGATTVADAHDTTVVPMTDVRFAFGSVGASPQHGRPAEGFWFPGSEGEVTYRGNTYPGGQMHAWRYRYTPLQAGAEQNYTVDFRVGHAIDFREFQHDTWRWAYATLAPEPRHQDIAAMERGITDILATQAITRSGRTGLPNSIDAADPHSQSDEKAVLGFTGKNLEAAEFLLAEADLESDAERSKRDRDVGNAIFATFVQFRMNPPVGEGYVIATGTPTLAIVRDNCVFLRSFGDDMKSTMRAYLREKHAGREHAEWLAWTRGFTDWLLTFQSRDGSFPRSWRPATGVVADTSPQSSYNPIPLLLLMTQATGDMRYREAAIRAGEFAWNSGQMHGQFVGGTIDNPDILDKEAGTLSLEAYLALYDTTYDRRWLDCARAAADYAESYIYLWNVPMAVDENAEAVAWKPEANTTGTQLIATGHSLTDDYMAFDVDSYAHLWKLTGDLHYRDVARLLLLGTKEMIADVEHPYDLRGTGWQQEHWSFAPPRGNGLHRRWLPWVATSQLKGIIALREDDPELFRKLASEGAGR